jgi:hypothetical protein
MQGWLRHRERFSLSRRHGQPCIFVDHNGYHDCDIEAGVQNTMRRDRDRFQLLVVASAGNVSTISSKNYLMTYFTGRPQLSLALLSR